MSAGPLYCPEALWRAVATTIVPEARSFGAREWEEAESTLRWALERRPVAVRRQLSLFVRALDYLAVPRYGRRFTRLSAAQRLAWLQALEHSPWYLIRKGLWGLRTLVLMSVYTQRATVAAIGYRASTEGWQRRTS